MPQCPLSLSIRQTVTAVLALMTVTVGVGANKQSIESGRAIGQSVPSFYVRAVTGPLRNKSVCYVCRNGSRPCVMVLFRETSPVLGTLLKKIDKVVDRNRAKGLRSFGVLISPEPGRAISRLQTMAFNQKITLPLSVATDVVGSPSCQNIHKQAEVTVVLYRRQKVVERFGFRSKELGTAGTAQVLARIKRLLDES
jgi:hypothetical protein